MRRLSRILTCPSSEFASKCLRVTATWVNRFSSPRPSCRPRVQAVPSWPVRKGHSEPPSALRPLRRQQRHAAAKAG